MQGGSSESVGGYNPGERAPSSATASSSFITVELDATHRVDAFACSRLPDVEKFLREEARAHQEASLCETYVLPSTQDPTKIDGYYWLANASLRRDETADHIKTALPGDSPSIGVFIIPWLGRDDSTYRGLGAELIVDAARRGRSRGRTSWGLVLYAAKSGLVPYYQELGFRPAQKTIKQLARDRASGQESGNYYMYGPYEDLIHGP